MTIRPIDLPEHPSRLALPVQVMRHGRDLPAPLAAAGPPAALEGTVEVVLAAEPDGPAPGVGVQVASHGEPPSAHELDELRSVRPTYLWVPLVLTRPWWEHRLGQARAEAAALKASLEIEALCGDGGEGLDLLAAALAAHPAPLAAVHVYPAAGGATTERVMRRARAAFADAGVEAPLGGGARAVRTRGAAAPIPLDQMDFLSCAVPPLAPAADGTNGDDWAAVTETLAAQEESVAAAVRLGGGRPVRVAPVTLRPRRGPAAARSAGNEELDPRQLSLKAAAWTVASIARLTAAGAAALTYYETTGPLGMMERTLAFVSRPGFPSARGMRFPVRHAVESASRATLDERTRVLPLSVEPRGIVAAFARQHSSDLIRVTVANLLGVPQRVRVSWTGGRLPPASVYPLDETGYAARALERLYNWPKIERTPEYIGGPVMLDLLPYALSFVEIEWD